jgi:hypothetical protein
MNEPTFSSADLAWAIEIKDAADAGGTIQAADMVRLFPGQPERHACTSLGDALRAALGPDAPDACDLGDLWWAATCEKILGA